MLEEKNTQDQSYVLGQYFTPEHICESIVSRIGNVDGVFVEPSFGKGAFIDALLKKSKQVVGVEVDPSLFTSVRKRIDGNVQLSCQNFYDFRIDSSKPMVFVGNPPFRTPAYSLTTHKSFIANLTKKYGVVGIREEAVFFVLHTIDLILNSRAKCGEMHYILPLSVLKNNSKFYQKFKIFLKEKCEFLSIHTIEGMEFDRVSQDLVCLSLRVGCPVDQKKVNVDGELVNLDDFLCLGVQDIIPFQSIFKQTFLGSVPCESVLVSISGETKEEFRNRLCAIMEVEQLDSKRLYQLLQHKGRFHLKIFDKKESDPAVQAKLAIILSYIANMREKDGILDDFKNIGNYREIEGRNETLYYFRCEKLKKNKNFVYELNPNPCPSFYFTGNPSSSSTDYFGFCSYDVNRNVSPGANRTVPIANIEDNLTEFFKGWWRAHTDEPYWEVFNYICYISKTRWYKQQKAKNKRFYFGIPAHFVCKQERYLDAEIPREEVRIPLDECAE